MRYLWLFFLFFAGCMVGPNYQKPDLSMPEMFESSRGDGGLDEDLCQWWKQFNDPILDELIVEALHANYDLRIAVERIEQTRAQFRIEKSYLWPEIDLNAALSRTRISQNLFPTTPQATGFLPTFLNAFQIGFDAIWELDFFGKFRRAKNAAYYTWEATKEDAQNVLIAVLSEVAVNYINLRAVQKQIELTNKKIAADEKELAITSMLFQVGLDNEIQITTLISAIETDLASLPVLETSLKQTVYALAYLLGRQPEGLLETFQEAQPIPSSRNRVPVGLPSDLLRRRPDVRSAERQLAAATEQVGVAVADLFPHISLTGLSLGTGNQGGSTFGFESAELGKLLKHASEMFSIGANINWDLLDFGKVRAQIDVQKSLQRQALLSYEQTVIASLKDVESALVAYFEEDKRRESMTKKVEADRRTFEITKTLYEIGLSNELQVLEAQKTLLVSESNLVESEQALSGDLIAIYKAIGGEWDSPSSH